MDYFTFYLTLAVNFRISAADGVQPVEVHASFPGLPAPELPVIG